MENQRDKSLMKKSEHVDEISKKGSYWSGVSPFAAWYGVLNWRWAAKNVQCIYLYVNEMCN